MFEYKFSARGYELDSYGHVNHAVYLNYFEQARWELFRQADLLQQLREEELLLVVIEVNVRYSREINMFDEMVVYTEIVKEPPYLVFQHKMYFGTSKVKACSATVKTLFTEKGKLVRDIPESILQKLS
jgi:YbgC/YbaW family acyl-CoA thioester hydrolase